MSEEVESSGPGSKALLLVGLLIGLLVGGGVMLVLDLGAPPPTAEELAAKKKKEEEEKKKPKELFSVLFDRLTVGIYAQRKDGRSRYIGNYYVKVAVEVGAQNDKIIVERLKDRLQHGFLSVITKGNYTRDGSSTELDLDKLSKLLKVKAEEIIGGNKVLNVAVLEALRVSN